TISKLMKICEVVNASNEKITSKFTPEDLNHFYEVAKNTENFCGFVVSISAKTALQFMKNLNGRGERNDTWTRTEKREGQLEIRVKRLRPNICYTSEHDDLKNRFIIYNYDCEAKYPGLRDRLYGDEEFSCY
ncbi:hypothetical protein PMAYCL1PPCAC_05054, partial [Pristionchus mayeri]